MIRFSRVSDLSAIQELIGLCFGDRTTAGVYDNLPGRYLVFELDGKVVAMTGLTANTPYPYGVEVDWTCTHPDYQHRGIMTLLFTRLMALTDDVIYCSCWHLQDDLYPVLHLLMVQFGFECVCKSHISCNSYRCGIFDTQRCVHYRLNCMCTEDLYVRHSELIFSNIDC